MAGVIKKTDSEQGQGIKEAEIGIRQLQAKECQGFPANSGTKERGKGRFFPRAFRRSITLLTP